MKFSRLMIFIPMLAACTGSVPEMASTHQSTLQVSAVTTAPVEFDSISGPSPLYRRVNWRELRSIYSDIAGLYRVSRMYGTTEDVPNKPGVRSGFTYVVLSLNDAWSDNAPSQVTARISGGPTGVGSTYISWGINLRKGEFVGVFMAPPKSANNGYYMIDELGTFRVRSDGTLSNGMLFEHEAITPSAMKALVASTARGTESEHFVATTPDMPPSVPFVVIDGGVPTIVANAGGAGSPVLSTPTSPGSVPDAGPVVIVGDGGAP